jgi:hypothetical protein
VDEPEEFFLAGVEHGEKGVTERLSVYTFG